MFFVTWRGGRPPERAVPAGSSRRAWEVMLWSCWGAAGEPRTGTAQKKHFEQGELRKEVLTTENAQSKECSGQWVLRTRSAQDRAHRTRSA
eukprot:1158079-Pelagomonas_calceolata.AAC.8